MCLGIPGQIVEVLREPGDLALVDVSGTKRQVNVGLLDGEPVTPGDWILIHTGFALMKIDEQEARDAMSFLERLGQAGQVGQS